MSKPTLTVALAAALAACGRNVSLPPSGPPQVTCTYELSGVASTPRDCGGSNSSQLGVPAPEVTGKVKFHVVRVKGGTLARIQLFMPGNETANLPVAGNTWDGEIDTLELLPGGGTLILSITPQDSQGNAQAPYQYSFRVKTPYDYLREWTTNVGDGPAGPDTAVAWGGFAMHGRNQHLIWLDDAGARSVFSEAANAMSILQLAVPSGAAGRAVVLLQDQVGPAIGGINLGQTTWTADPKNPDRLADPGAGWAGMTRAASGQYACFAQPQGGAIQLNDLLVCSDASLAVHRAVPAAAGAPSLTGFDWIGTFDHWFVGAEMDSVTTQWGIYVHDIATATPTGPVQFTDLPVQTFILDSATLAANSGPYGAVFGALNTYPPALDGTSAVVTVQNGKIVSGLVASWANGVPVAVGPSAQVLMVKSDSATLQTSLYLADLSGRQQTTPIVLDYYEGSGWPTSPLSAGFHGDGSWYVLLPTTGGPVVVFGDAAGQLVRVWPAEGAVGYGLALHLPAAGEPLFYVDAAGNVTELDWPAP